MPNTAQDARLILRRDPVGSMIDTDRQIESCLQSFHGIVPVPERWLLERKGACSNVTSHHEPRRRRQDAVVMMLEPYGKHADAIGRELFAILGRIARCDPSTLPIRNVLHHRPRACWREQLDAWQSVIERDERHPQPIVRAAMRRLRRNPPNAAARVSVIHGDYRSGNVLHDGQAILAVLDWEWPHLAIHWGSRLGLRSLVDHFDESRVAGTIGETEAVAIWEREGGLVADKAALACGNCSAR